MIHHRMGQGRRRGISLVIVLAAVGLPTAVAWAATPLSVTEVRWTNAVTDGQYVESYDGTAPFQPLYLWMRVRGGREALDQLKAQGRLPIRHRWFKVLGTQIRYDQCTDVINLDIGNEATLQPLTTELTSRGFFDWRTWSMKDHVSPGWWLVTLEYATGEAVLCGDDAHKCEFGIDIE